MESEVTSAEAQIDPQWKPIPRMLRRVLGVLVEKAKTTPNGYPMTLNAITTGCNQKSNRHPQMDLGAEDVEDALTELRQAGAVGEIQDGGRVAKYRHYSKDWLGVDGAELAVMAELLLRGPQTIGELRGRAARMAHGLLPDMSALSPVLQSLMHKNLVISLTPEGRGQIVTHALYEADELAHVRAKLGEGEPPAAVTGPAPPAPTAVSHTAAPAVADLPAATASGGAGNSTPAADASVRALQQEISQMKTEMDRLKKEVEDIWANLGQ